MNKKTFKKATSVAGILLTAPGIIGGTAGAVAITALATTGAQAESTFAFKSVSSSIDSKESFTAGQIANVGIANINFTIPDGTPVGGLSDTVAINPELRWSGFDSGATLPAYDSTGAQVGEWVKVDDTHIQLKVTADLSGKTNISGTTKISFGTALNPRPANEQVITPAVTTTSGTSVADWTYTYKVSTVTAFTESYSGQISVQKKINQIFYSTPEFRASELGTPRTFTFNLDPNGPNSFDQTQLKGLAIRYGDTKSTNDVVSFSFYELTTPGVSETKTSRAGTVINKPGFTYQISPDGKSITLNFSDLMEGYGWTGNVPLVLNDAEFNKGLADGQIQDYKFTATSNTPETYTSGGKPATFNTLDPNGIYPGTNLPYGNLRYEFNTATAKADVVPTVSIKAYADDADFNGKTDDSTAQNSDAPKDAPVATFSTTGKDYITLTNTNTQISENLILKAADGTVLKVFPNVAPGASVTFNTADLKFNEGANSATYTVVAENVDNTTLTATASDDVNRNVYVKSTLKVAINNTIDKQDADTTPVVVLPGEHTLETVVSNDKTSSEALTKANTQIIRTIATYDLSGKPMGSVAQPIELPANFNVAPGASVTLPAEKVTLNSGETLRISYTITSKVTDNFPQVLGGDTVVTATATDPTNASGAADYVDLLDDSSRTELGKDVTLNLISNDKVTSANGGPVAKMDATSIKITEASKGTVSADGKKVTAENGTWTVNADGTATWSWAEGTTDLEVPTFKYTATDTYKSTLENATTPIQPAKVTVVSFKAQPDTFVTDFNKGVDIDVLTNDSDTVKWTSFKFLDDSGNEVDSFTTTEGVFTITEDGKAHFQPVEGFEGEVPAINYVAISETGDKSVSTISGTVNPAANPEATDDSFETPYGEPVVIKVLENDTLVEENSTWKSVDLLDKDGNPVKELVTDEGTFTVNEDNTVTFTPAEGFSGDVPEVSYRATDSNGKTVDAKITGKVGEKPAEPEVTPEPTPEVTPGTPKETTPPVAGTKTPVQNQGANTGADALAGAGLLAGLAGALGFGGFAAKRRAKRSS